jgi:hypothetical protein
MPDEPLSAYVRRCRGRNPEGPDWLAGEIRVLEDAVAHARHRAEKATDRANEHANNLLRITAAITIGNRPSA